MRSTLDLDFLFVKGKVPNEKRVKEIINNVCSIKGDCSFSFFDVSPIKERDNKPGLRVRIGGKLGHFKRVFGVDIASGDVITPQPIQYYYRSLLTNQSLNILSYNKETVLAEKFVTIFEKGLSNSRSKDLYDIYLLMKREDIDLYLLRAAIINTFVCRGLYMGEQTMLELINEYSESNYQKSLFSNYCKNHRFAQNISYSYVIDLLRKLVNNMNYSKGLPDIYGIELHVIRHGQDEKDKTGGWSENHLTAKGVVEIKKALNDLDNDYSLFISSDLTRAKESSNIINFKLGMNIEYDKKLRETNNGDLANKTIKECEEKYAHFVYANLAMDECYPHGESPNQFFVRVRDKLITLFSENRGKKILLVTHGGVITVLLCLIYGFPYSNQLKIAPGTGLLTKYNI
jgi:broad specificity phosphatase PhoE